MTCWFYRCLTRVIFAILDGFSFVWAGIYVESHHAEKWVNCSWQGERDRRINLFFWCIIRYLPPTYVGPPLDAFFNSISVWDLMEEQFKGSWLLGKNNICLEGRLMLIKSTLSSLLIDIMSLSVTLGLLEATWRRSKETNYDTERRKLHLVTWSIVCLDRSNGGLGIRRLSILNKTFFWKWL